MNNDVLINISKWIPYYRDNLLLFSVNKSMYQYFLFNKNNILNECSNISLQYYDFTKHAIYVYYYSYAIRVKHVLNNHLFLIPSTDFIKNCINSMDDHMATGQRYYIKNYFSLDTNNTNVSVDHKLCLYLLQKLLKNNYGWSLKAYVYANFIKDDIKYENVLYIAPY